MTEQKYRLAEKLSKFLLNALCQNIVTGRSNSLGKRVDIPPPLPPVTLGYKNNI